MADYIRDEEEQAERLKEWWQKNGTATIVVIVLAIGSMIGWRQWQEHSSGQAAEAYKVYESLVAGLGQGGSADQVRSAADTLLEDFESTAYADYARLALAKLAADDGNLNGAAEQLKAVADDAASKELEYTARVRLARVQIEQGDLDAAEKQISRTFPEAWQAQALELKGDIAGAREKWDAARDAYTSALDALDNGAAKDRVQMKLDDMKSL